MKQFTNLYDEEATRLENLLVKFKSPFTLHVLRHDELISWDGSSVTTLTIMASAKVNGESWRAVEYVDFNAWIRTRGTNTQLDMGTLAFYNIKRYFLKFCFDE